MKGLLIFAAVLSSLAHTSAAETPVEVAEKIKHEPENYKRLKWMNDVCFGPDEANISDEVKEQIYFIRWDVDRQICDAMDKMRENATDPAELSAIDREWDYYYYYTFSIMAERAAGGNPCDVCPHWLSPEE